ncbi:MAG TPA: sigma-70 family RNA polymerase sigma factor [Ktedonobacterales bacterium]
MEESSVIRRAQTGDQRAFQQLVETYHALVWRTARTLLGDATAAEEVEQEAWLDVWRGLPTFQADRPFRPWLLTVVANRSRKHARRHVVVVEPLDEFALEIDVGASDGIAHALKHERSRELAQTVASLPAEQSRVLALRYFADLDLAEIAAVTDAPLGTVKSRLHRALSALRERLSQEWKLDISESAASLKTRADY